MHCLNRRTWIVVGLLAIGAAACAVGTGAGAPEEAGPPAGEPMHETPKLVLRAYDVADLAYTVPDYGGYMPQFDLAALSGRAEVGHFGETFAAEGASLEAEAFGRREMADALKRLVNSMQDEGVGAWADEGGPAVIEHVRGKLLIRQTPEAHRQIEALLAGMRAGAPLHRTVLVDVRWVQVKARGAERLLADLAAGPGAPQEVSRERLEECGAEVAYRGRISCLDGQRVYASATGTVAYTSDAEPIVSEKAAAYSPVISTIPAGLVLRVKPIVLPDGKAALLEIKSEVCEVALGERAALKHGDPPATAEIDLPRAVVRQLETTVRLPLDTDVLVAGTNAPNERGSPALYMVLRVSASQ